MRRPPCAIRATGVPYAIGSPSASAANSLPYPSRTRQLMPPSS
jgi:hypothetical protein